MGAVVGGVVAVAVALVAVAAARLVEREPTRLLATHGARSLSLKIPFLSYKLELTMERL